MNKIALTFANITLLFKRGGGFPLRFPDTYMPFVVCEQTDAICEIQIHTDIFPYDIHEVAYRFISNNIWAAFLWQNGWGFLTPFTDKRHWRRLILWQPAERHADLWIQGIEPIEDVFWDLRFPFLAALVAYHGGGLLHAAAVKIKTDEAWLFIGQSGHGKSTWSRLLQARGYPVLDEDRVALRAVNGEVWAFGVPWHPEPRLCSPEGAPVRRIYFLREAEPDSVKPASDVASTTGVLKSFLMPAYDPQAMQTLLDLAAQTAGQAQNYFLGYATDETLLECILP